MKPIASRKGLRYPDEFLVRHFFRNRLHESAGRVLELGCGNGSNLECYASFGYDVTGVDIAHDSLAAAEWNFDGSGHWVCQDLSAGLPALAGPFDVLLMPSSMYYIPRAAFVACLEQARSLLASSAHFFIRMRSLADYRFARGTEIERNGYRLQTPETGETGLLNVFYAEHEIVDILQRHLGASELTVLRVQFESERPGGGVIINSDVIAYGIIRR